VLVEIGCTFEKILQILLWLSFRPRTVMCSRLRCSLPRTWKLVRESKAVPQFQRFQRVGP
jgi:hypothetical protein